MEDKNDMIQMIILIFILTLPIICIFIMSIKTLIYYYRLNIKQKIFMKIFTDKIIEVSNIIENNDNINNNLDEINQKINDIYNLYNNNKIELSLSYIYFDKNSIVDDIKSVLVKKEIINKDKLNEKISCLYENNIIIRAEM
jgi:hypothetical protein